MLVLARANQMSDWLDGDAAVRGSGGPPQRHVWRRRSSSVTCRADGMLTTNRRGRSCARNGRMVSASRPFRVVAFAHVTEALCTNAPVVELATGINFLSLAPLPWRSSRKARVNTSMRARRAASASDTKLTTPMAPS